MDTLKAITNRKSVRAYTGAKVDEADLKVLLKAAQASPVAMGRYEDLTLTVVQDEKLLQAIDQSAAKAMGHSGMLYGAPLFFIVSTPLSHNDGDNSAYANAATIVENINIAAVAMNLGACHIWGATSALAKDEALKKRLAIPENQTPVAGLTVGAFEGGYADREIPEKRLPTKRFD